MIRLGVEQEMAYQRSRSRIGGWAIALRRSPHECIALTVHKMRFVTAQTLKILTSLVVFSKSGMHSAKNGGFYLVV